MATTPNMNPNPSGQLPASPSAPIPGPEGAASVPESHSEPTPTASQPSSAGPSVPSVLQTLRTERENIEKTKTHNFPIPGYGGKLVGLFSVIPWSKLRNIAASAEGSTSKVKELNAHADTILNSCQGLFYREDDGTVKPLNEKVNEDGGDGGEATITFNSERLGAILGFTNTSKTARENLLKTFNNDLGVSSFHNELTEWMRDTTKVVADEFLGESSGDLK